MNECRSHLLIRYKHRAGAGRRRRGNVTKPFPAAEETGGVTSSLPSSFSLLQLFKTGWRVSHTDADMTAVGELVLVLGLLVSAHCEVRARDPEVEEEEGELGGGGGGGGVFPLHPRTTETSPLGETGSNLARSGWVHKPLPPHSAKEK